MTSGQGGWGPPGGRPPDGQQPRPPGQPDPPQHGYPQSHGAPPNHPQQGYPPPSYGVPPSHPQQGYAQSHGAPPNHPQQGYPPPYGVQPTYPQPPHAAYPSQAPRYGQPAAVLRDQYGRPVDPARARAMAVRGVLFLIAILLAFVLSFSPLGDAVKEAVASRDGRYSQKLVFLICLFLAGVPMVPVYFVARALFLSKRA